MHIKMKILALNPAEHSVLVRYYTDKMGEEELALHDGRGHVDRREDGSPARCRTDVYLNIHDLSGALTEKRLVDYIFKFAPPNHAWFELMEKVADPAVDTSMNAVRESVGREFAYEPPPPPPPPGSDQVVAVPLRAAREPQRQIKTTVL
jgi:hypothetical protein